MSISNDPHWRASASPGTPLPIGTDIRALRAQYRSEGFCAAAGVFPEALLPPVIAACRAVAEGSYETGQAPLLRQWNPEDPRGSLVKIAEPHQSNRTLCAFLGFPRFGRLCGELVDAEWVQVWAVDLITKPAKSSRESRVGWHRDDRYMSDWDGEVFTAWIALSGVSENSGAIRYSRRSHRWEDGHGGDFHRELPREAFSLPDGERWEEVTPRLAPGAVLFHHRRTLHASNENTTPWPRFGLALRLRTERARPLRVEGRPLLHRLNDLTLSPVIFSRDPDHRPVTALPPVTADRD